MKQLLDIFEDIKNILDGYGIVFWLEHGTLLGMVREGHIIKGDDDIDLACKYEELTKHIQDISNDLYQKGYDTYITDVKLTVKKQDSHLSIYLYKKDRIPEHHSRYRISKKNYLAHILLYGFLEGLRTPYKDRLHNPNLKHLLINLSKTLMMYLPMKEQLHHLILLIGTKLDSLFIFDIAFPSGFISDFKTIDFYSYKVNIPIQYKKYLTWMYGTEWTIPNPYYNKQWDFYNDMENYNNIRSLGYNLKKITKILKDNHIHFWMYGGALLGYIRDRELIPWDKDIDLFIWETDKHQLHDLKKTFRNIGYRYLFKDGSVMLRWNDKNITIAYYTQDKNIAYLEKLCTRNKIGNMIYFGLLCKTIEYRLNHLTCFLKWLLLKTHCAYRIRQEVPLHFFKDLKKIVLLDVELLVPQDAEEYLEYTFGKNWHIPIKDFKYTPEYVKIIEGDRPTKAKYHSDSIA